MSGKQPKIGDLLTLPSGITFRVCHVSMSDVDKYVKLTGYEIHDGPHGPALQPCTIVWPNDCDEGDS